MDPLAHLLELRAKPERLILGMQSGTSADGIDAALVQITGSAERTRPRLLAFTTFPYDSSLRDRLLAIANATTAELCDLNFLVGKAFAEAAAQMTNDCDLIGSHGQTVCHRPRSQGGIGSTLQIGEAAVIAEQTNTPVICDLRVRDVAAQGEGAPLVPLADFYLFHEPGRVRALQNIGGIANVTVVPDDLDRVFAFDNGPGNIPLDAIARTVSGGTEFFDKSGARAARGRIDGALLAKLHADPFFSLSPPRSTGREAFGESWLAPLLSSHADRLDDLMATLTRFCAEAIRKSYALYVEPKHRIDEVLVSGGGVFNATLMEHLVRLFAPIPVRSIAELGIDPHAKEAIAFAILANETLFGLPGNVPRATGALGPRILGKIVLP